MRETGINFGEILSKMMEREGKSVNDLELGADLERTHIYALLKGSRKPNLKTMEKIGRYLGYDIAFVKRKKK